MAKILFTPSGKQGEFSTKDNKTILQLANDLGLEIESSCAGIGKCGKCQIEIISADKPANNIKQVEINHRQTKYLKDNLRLSCCTKITADCVINIPNFSQVQKQIIRKDIVQKDFPISQITKTYNIIVQKPSIDYQAGLAQLLKEAISKKTSIDISKIQIPLEIIFKLNSFLEKNNYKISVIIRENNYIFKVIEIQEYNINKDNNLYGIAFDIGSTTIVGHLACLNTGDILASKSIMNPQIRFGEDVLARVSFIMMNETGLFNMNRVLVKEISGLIKELVKTSKIERSKLLEMTFVANPIMHHILLNIDPTSLGQSPFVLATDESIYLETYKLKIKTPTKLNKSYILPCIAGHVGADTASVLLALGLEKYQGNSLAVDIGTNAEVILTVNGKTYACSSPTGPAFEGAEITKGQRAAIGAIEKVEINKNTLEPRFKVIGCELWSDNKEFANKTKNIVISGICGSGIIDIVAQLFLAEIINEDGVFDENLAVKNTRIFKQGRTYSYLIYSGNTDVFITQNDIRQIQLAKAALYAGVKLLMEKANIEKLDRIFLAGAFGSFIDVKQAMILGLIPDCALENVKAVGNAAGDGALITLLNKEKRKKIEQQVKQINKIETALEPSFQELFINAMAFPNKVDKFTELEKIISLPEKQKATTGRRTNRRAGRK